MFGLLHPVGPEGERTYWVRRAIVIGAAIVIIAAIVAATLRLSAGATDGDPKAAETSAPAVDESAPPEENAADPEPGGPDEQGGQGDNGGEGGQEPAPAPSPEADGTETPAGDGTLLEGEQPQAEEQADEAPAPVPEEQPAPEAPARAQAPECTPEQLEVAVDGADEVSKAAGAQPFGVVVTNTGTANCTLPVSADNLKVTIFTGTERIWSTEDCAAVIPARSALLAPGAWISSDVTWGIGRSAAGCATASGEIPTGDYRVVAELAEVVPAQREFSLV